MELDSFHKYFAVVKWSHTKMALDLPKKQTVLFCVFFPQYQIVVCVKKKKFEQNWVNIHSESV